MEEGFIQIRFGKKHTQFLGNAMTSITQLKVEGMSCSGCSSKLKRALESIDGVSEADVVLEGGQVVVHFDPTIVDPAKFAAVVEDVGFDVVT